jgi:carbohydrate diacid regulator
MILSQELAQKCVDRIMKNLGHNINIMNNQGIIIASGSKERIGTYHIIAEKAVKKKKRIDVYKEDAEKYKGVKEGINMPFFYKSMIIGVIGITGNPDSLEKTAKIVKMAVELMIEQELSKEQRHIHSNQIKVLVNKLLESTSEEDFYNLTQLGSKLGYDLQIPRIACILATDRMDNFNLTSMTITFNQIKDTLLKEIESIENSSIQDIICNIDINRILILKTVNDTEHSHIKNYILDFYMQLRDKIKSKLGKEIYFTVGSLHENVLGIKESYEEAMFTLDYLLKCKTGNKIAFIEDYMIEYLCTKLPNKYLEHFLLNYVEKIKGKEELINTIKSLVMNNMNLKKAAEDLYVHRNTIIFRVNKIKELLDIDPVHNDTDRILLRLLYYYIRINSF